LSKKSQNREQERKAAQSAVAQPCLHRGSAPQPFFRFAMTFGAATVALYAASYLPFCADLLDRYVSLNCDVACGLLNLLGQHSRVHGSSLLSAHFAEDIKLGCTAFDLMVFCVATIAAHPASLRRKMAGLIAGMGAMALLNLLRITSIFLVGIYSPALFPAFHEELWPGLMVLSAIAAMLAWMGWVAASSEGKEGNGFPVPAFVRRFVLVYGLLLVPWPGLANLCRGGLCAAGTEAFFTGRGAREVTFVPLHAHETRIEIVNRKLMLADGSGPVRNVDVNAFALLWRPTSVLLAMVLGAPVSLRVRLKAIGVGIAVLTIVLWATMAFLLWNESTAVYLHTLSNAWKAVADCVEENLVVFLGLSAPFLLSLVSLGVSGASWRGLFRNLRSPADATTA
jgi:exosortase H (IPTLxxWG-CTERM-specific)